MDYVLATVIFLFVFVYALNGKWPLQGLLTQSQFKPYNSAPSALYHQNQPRRFVSSSVPRNCGEARARGIAPIYRHEPEYGAHLDSDGDGVACEPYRGR